MTRLSSIFPALAAALVLATAVSANPEFAAKFSGDVNPFVQENCVECHGTEKQKGDFRFDELSRDLN